MKFIHPDGSITGDLPFEPHMGQYQSLIDEGFKPLTNEDAVDNPNVVPANDLERCSGKTKSGDRCNRKAQEGSIYCASHQPKADEAPAPADSDEDTDNE